METVIPEYKKSLLTVYFIDNFTFIIAVLTFPVLYLYSSNILGV